MTYNAHTVLTSFLSLLIFFIGTEFKKSLSILSGWILNCHHRHHHMLFYVINELRILEFRLQNFWWNLQKKIELNWNEMKFWFFFHHHQKWEITRISFEWMNKCEAKWFDAHDFLLFKWNQNWFHFILHQWFIMCFFSVCVCVCVCWRGSCFFFFFICNDHCPFFFLMPLLLFVCFRLFFFQFFFCRKTRFSITMKYI